jgi:hypothetical protein
MEDAKIVCGTESSTDPALRESRRPTLPLETFD